MRFDFVRLSALIPLALVPLAACTEDEPALGSEEAAIASEQPDGVAEIVGRFRMGHPDRLLASYAAGRVNGGSLCSATLIGPNAMMTASHCGSGDRSLELYAYNHDSDPTRRTTERFSCRYLLTTFPATDLVLYYCDPNAAGESPGIKYGYLDFDLAFDPIGSVDYDASKAKVRAGTAIYSTWWNPISDLSLSNEMLYSSGTVEAVDNGDGSWYSPSAVDNGRADLGQCDSVNLPLRVVSDIWGAPGTSGSSILSRASNRIVAGPVSTAVTDGLHRGALGIADYLAHGVIQTPDAVSCGRDAAGNKMVNGTMIRDRWNLTAGHFRGVVDADNDGVFDLQHRVERIEGEPQRASYWLGFDSARSNRLWTAPRTALPNSGIARLINDSAAGSWLRQATNPRLNLRTGVAYHVSFTARSDRRFSVCLGNRCSTHDATDNLTTWVGFGAVLTPDLDEVRLWTLGGGTTELGKLAIVEMGSTSDLDTADDRHGWRLVRNSVWGTATPNIVPLGTSSATSADWALVVHAGMYSVGNENLPFQPGRTRVCYSTRKNPLNPASMESRIRVLDNGTTRTSQLVFHSASWQRFCTPWFNMTTSRGTVQFGLDPTTNGSYLIDDVTVERS